MKKLYSSLCIILFLFSINLAQAQLSGSYTIGIDQDFSTLKEAFDTLMTEGNSGDVAFLITEDLTESANVVLGFDPGEENTVTIRPLPGTAPVVTFLGTSTNSFYDGALVIGLTEPDGGGAALTLTRNIIFDGSSEPGGNSRDLTLRTDTGALGNNVFRIIGDTDNIQFLNTIFEINQSGNPFNTIRITSRSDSRHEDIRLINNEITNLNANSARAIITDGIVNAVNGPVLTIENNDILTRRYGIWLREVGGSSFIRGNNISIDHTGNFFAYGVLVDETASPETVIEIENNSFTNSFSPNTMVGIRASAPASYQISGNDFSELSSGDGITRGIWAEAAGNYSISNNIFSQFDSPSEVRFIEFRDQTGLITITGNTFENSSVSGDLTAVLLNSPTEYSLESNMFRALSAEGLFTALELEAGSSFLIDGNEFTNFRGDGGLQVISFNSGMSSSYTATLTNNMITGFSSEGSGENLFGIILRSPADPAEASLRMYNNSILMNPLTVSGSGWTYRGLSVFSNARISVDLLNNIFVNADNNGSSVISHAYYQGGSAASDLSADFNLWFVENPESSETWLSRHGAASTNTATLEGHQNSTGEDENAIFKSVEFVSSDDLRLSGNSLGDFDLAGLPLAEVPADIDGTPRDPDNPYRGAFEGPQLNMNERIVTFSVDMSIQQELENFSLDAGDQVFLRGDFNDFGLDDEMSPVAENSLVYSISRAIEGEAGTPSEYKFFIQAGDGRTLPNDGWELLGEDPMLNRVFTLGEPGSEQVLDTVFFNDDDSLPEPDLVIVWPGDANNDGIVDELDVLSLGTFWGSTGPAREDSSSDWTPQPAEPWNPEVATYSDTNGDGVVNHSDLLAVGLNFGKTHANRADTHSNPFTVLLPDLNPGDQLTAKIRPASDVQIQGLAYDLEIEGAGSNAIQLDETQKGDWAENWYESGNLLSFSQHEVPVFRGAWVHKGLTAPVSASQFFVMDFSIHESILSGNLSINRLVVSVADGEQISWSDFDIELIHTVGTSLPGNELPAETALHQNYPNPFNPQTKIAFDLASAEIVTLEVMNILGQRVASLVVNESLTAGSHTRTFDGSSLSSGIYLIRLSAGNQVYTRKMMLVK